MFTVKEYIQRKERAIFQQLKQTNSSRSSSQSHCKRWTRASAFVWNGCSTNPTNCICFVQLSSPLIKSETFPNEGFKMGSTAINASMLILVCCNVLQCVLVSRCCLQGSQRDVIRTRCFPAQKVGDLQVASSSQCTGSWAYTSVFSPQVTVPQFNVVESISNFRIEPTSDTDATWTDPDTRASMQSHR